MFDDRTMMNPLSPRLESHENDANRDCKRTAYIL